MITAGKIILLIGLGLYALYILRNLGAIGSAKTKATIIDGAAKDSSANIAQEQQENAIARDDDPLFVDRNQEAAIVEEKKKLSLEERIQLSWAFLYRITDKIIKFFSREDNASLLRAGATLRKHGGAYVHNIEQEFEKSFSISQNINKSESKEKSR